MSFAREFSLQPELVSDVIEELLEADIICQKQIRCLKLEHNTPKYDPNTLMDVRHEQIKKRSMVILNETKPIEDKRILKVPKQIQVNHLQIDKEIENFKKELQIERKKLYELAKLSNDYKRTVCKQNSIVQPVTNIVTQRKTKIAEMSTAVVESEKTVSIQENDKVLKESTQNYIVFRETPIEVFGYKPLCMVAPVSNTICLNHQSPLCTHNGITNKKDETNSKKCQKEPNITKDKLTTNQNHPQFFFGGNTLQTDCNQKNKVIVTKTIKKWKSFVMHKKINRFCKEERLLKIKMRRYLLRKYWDEWVNFWRNIRERKEELIKQKKRTEKMNVFFEKLEEKKKELEINTKCLVKENVKEKPLSLKKTILYDKSSVVKNRLSAQKSIIKEQKEKLKEQEKLIQQLKEDKLKEDMKTFRENLQTTIQETVKIFDKRLKPKVKQLALKANIYTDNTPVVSECDFVKRMNDRAQERKEKWDIIRLKKQMIEEEKLRKKIEDEENKRLEEEHAKRRKIQERKNKIRLEKEMELQRLLEIEITKEKIKEARTYYNNLLMKKTMLALKDNVSFMKQQEYKCKMYFKRKLLERCFKQWKENTDIAARREMATAEAFYTYNLLSKCWADWILFYSEAVQKRQVAEDFYDAKLQEKAFVMWKMYTDKQHIISDRKMQTATSHYNRNLLKKYFYNWKKLPRIMYNTREEEKRIRAWREKILEIIPDFKPELIYNDEDENIN